MIDGNLHHELEVAIRLAHEAGEAIMGYYRTGLAVQHKAASEPVTAADHAADELIAAGLASVFPGDGVLTEESDDDRSRLDKRRVWIVDPLDGTAEFLAETGEFAVHIALAVGGYPALGVVYQPARQRLFYAVHGQGAYLVDEGTGAGARRLAVSAVAEPADMCLVASRSHYSPFLDAARQALGIGFVNRLGSVGLKVSLVARGECDLYLATTVSKEWDLCAPHALLLEAGGILTNLCGEPLIYNKPDVSECCGLVASNGLAHARIIDVLARLPAQTGVGRQVGGRIAEQSSTEGR